MKLEVFLSNFLFHFLISIIFVSFVIPLAASSAILHAGYNNSSDAKYQEHGRIMRRVHPAAAAAPRERMLHFDPDIKDELTELQELNLPEAFMDHKNEEPTQDDSKAKEAVLVHRIENSEILKEKTGKESNENRVKGSSSKNLEAPLYSESKKDMRIPSISLRKKSDLIDTLKNPIHSPFSTPNIDFIPITKQLEIVHPKGTTGLSKTKDWNKTQFSEAHTPARADISAPSKVQEHLSQVEPQVNNGHKNFLQFSLNLKPKISSVSSNSIPSTGFQESRASSLDRKTYNSPFVAFGVFIVSILTLAALMSQEVQNYDTGFTKIIDPVQNSWDRSFRGHLEFRNPHIHLPRQRVTSYRPPPYTHRKYEVKTPPTN